MAAERSPSVARADGARRSVAVPNGEGVASGSATRVLKKSCSISKKFKNLRVFRQSPFARRAGAPSDVRGLWHARPLPTTSALDKSRPAAAQQYHEITIAN